MKKSRFGEEQMVTVLSQVDRSTITELARKCKVGEQRHLPVIIAVPVSSTLRT